MELILVEYKLNFCKKTNSAK